MAPAASLAFPESLRNPGAGALNSSIYIAYGQSSDYCLEKTVKIGVNQASINMIS